MTSYPALCRALFVRSWILSVVVERCPLQVGLGRYGCGLSARMVTWVLVLGCSTVVDIPQLYYDVVNHIHIKTVSRGKYGV